MRSSSAVRMSSAEKGSSMQRSSGRPTSARAMPTRCFMPPESSFGKARSCPSRPTALSDALHAALGLGRGQGPAVQPDAHVLLHGQPGKEREVLEHDGRARMDALERDSVLFDAARARRNQADEDAQERGLAAARGAEDGHDLARAHLEIDVLQDGARAPRLVGVDLVHAADGGDGRRGGGGRTGAHRLRLYFVSARR